MKAIRSNIIPVFLGVTISVALAISVLDKGAKTDQPTEVLMSADGSWVAPVLDFDKSLTGHNFDMVMYGGTLIANTAKYLGPQGSVLQISNGMNCQNCHLEAGTKQWGNNYGSVYSTYPKFRARSGTIENIYKRVNDCFERSLNGSKLDTGSYEMQSIYAYIKWLGKNVKKGTVAKSSGLPVLKYLNRPASPENGKIIYANSCQRCHGVNGEGEKNNDGISYLYPPLWGPSSYTDGAGLYRISRFASFVSSNMPLDQASHNSPALTTEEAWDVAAFVNSQPRPHIDQSNDFRDIISKAIDEPFGPYNDPFTEKEHKYGPFTPILDFRNVAGKDSKMLPKSK